MADRVPADGPRRTGSAAASGHPVVEVASRGEWRAWLEENHASPTGIWLVTYPKSDAARHVGYDAIVEEALCFGWIDSLPRKRDDGRRQLLLAPRKPGSNWSRLNKERVERLERDGLMTPAGRAVVDAAKADGSWSALDEVEELREPDDLRAALDANPAAREHWDGFPRSARRGILECIVSAKREETRARRVAETVEKAAEGIRANQWRQPKG